MAALTHLDIEADIDCLKSLDKGEEASLRALISKYRRVLQLNERYRNVDNIENEVQSINSSSMVQEDLEFVSF